MDVSRDDFRAHMEPASTANTGGHHHGNGDGRAAVGAHTSNGHHLHHHHSHKQPSANNSLVVGLGGDSLLEGDHTEMSADGFGKALMVGVRALAASESNNASSASATPAKSAQNNSTGTQQQADSYKKAAGAAKAGGPGSSMLGFSGLIREEIAFKQPVCARVGVRAVVCLCR